MKYTLQLCVQHSSDVSSLLLINLVWLFSTNLGSFFVKICSELISVLFWTYLILHFEGMASKTHTCSKFGLQENQPLFPFCLWQFVRLPPNSYWEMMWLDKSPQKTCSWEVNQSILNPLLFYQSSISWSVSFDFSQATFPKISTIFSYNYILNIHIFKSKCRTIRICQLLTLPWTCCTTLRCSVIKLFFQSDFFFLGHTFSSFSQSFQEARSSWTCLEPRIGVKLPHRELTRTKGTMGKTWSTCMSH